MTANEFLRMIKVVHMIDMQKIKVNSFDHAHTMLHVSINI